MWKAYDKFITGPLSSVDFNCISRLFMLSIWQITNFEKKYEFIRYGFSLVWVLVLILIRAILEQSINNKMVSKI